MKSSSLIGAVVVGASLVLAAIAFALVSALMREAGEGGPAALALGLERDIAAQGEEIAALRAEVARLDDRIEALEARPPPERSSLPAPELGALPPDAFEGEGPLPGTPAMVEQMELAKARFNRGIERPRPDFLRELLGEPRASYSQDCQPVTNPRLVDALETRAVAGFRLTMLRPALDSVERVVTRLRAEEPEILAALGTAGALCVRLVRGSTRSISSHAWGIAVDLTLEGDLDRMGDGGTQFGLVVLAEFFNDEGWYWGAGYGREDSMHFEVGEALLREWAAGGRI